MKAVKAFWLFSFAGYLAVSLYIYAESSNTLGISNNNNAYDIGKQELFYYGLAGLVLVNALVLLLANASPYLSLPFKKRWQYNSELRKMYKSRIKEWVRGFALLGNLMLINLQLAIYVLNSPGVNAPVSFIFSAIGVFTIAWLLAFFPLFGKTPELD